jgi:glycosyltransferase involved in cell wall biosynthesis
MTSAVCDEGGATVRILVYPPAMRIGGSQLGAVELAEELIRRRHEVVVFAEDGTLSERVNQAGIPFVAAPERPKVRPWLPTAHALNHAVDKHGIDLVHAFEWPPILEAVGGPLMTRGVPVVGTVMSMSVAPFIPVFVPLIVGTAHLADVERQRRPVVDLVEPSVDVDANRPGTTGTDIRRSLGAGDETLLVVVVSRLANELKREGLLEAVRAVGELATRRDIRLVVAGDGHARAEIEALSEAVNLEVGRDVVMLLGSVNDPRPVYDAADIALGMGSSALRAMAFGKPLIVQGERGFWRLLDRSSLEIFLSQGWYGIGDGRDGVPGLMTTLEELADDPVRRSELGIFARQVVCQRFSLERAGALHEQIYRRARAAVPRRTRVALRAAEPIARAYAHELRGRLDRLRRRGPTEDFNAISAQVRLAPLSKGAL